MDKLHKRVRSEEANLYHEYEDHSLQDVERSPFTNITNVPSSSSQIRHLKRRSDVAPLIGNRFHGDQSSSMQVFDTTPLSKNAKGHLAPGRYTLRDRKLTTHSKKQHKSLQPAGVVPVDLHPGSFQGFACQNVAADIDCTLNSVDSVIQMNSDGSDDVHSVHTINDTQCQNNYEDSDVPSYSDDSDDTHFVNTINGTQCNDNFQDSDIPSNSVPVEEKTRSLIAVPVGRI